MARLRVAVITDVHYGFDHKGKLGSKAPRLMKKFTKAVNKYNPDIVVDMGDRVTGRDSASDRKAMEDYRAHFNEIAAPLHSVVGNHDLKNLSRKDNEDIMGQPARSYTREVGGYHLVFWNPKGSFSKKQGITLEDEGIEWLRKDLAATNKPTIVFTHVPLDNMGREGSEPVSKRFLWTRGKEVQKIMEDAGNVVLVMSGHRHKNRYREINGIHYITQQSFTNQWKKHYRIPGAAHSFLDAQDDKIVVELRGKFKKTYDLVPRPLKL